MSWERAVASWRFWSVRDWNACLLRHYFGRGKLTSPVVVLLATPEELAAAVGESSLLAGEVKERFVECMCLALRQKRGLIDDAISYTGYPSPPRGDAEPKFVAHLIFTCVAAAVSDTDLADEASYIGRLRQLAGGQLPGDSLKELPQLWENLRLWLSVRFRTYRELKLPDPGGFTRIGHTVNLAFPDRRDQAELSAMLDRAGLMGSDPPIGYLLRLVGLERSHFRKSFLTAYDDFRKARQEGAPVDALLQHRFWAAVREACLRGRGDETPEGDRIRFTLLGDEYEGEVQLFVCSDAAYGDADFDSIQLEAAYGTWTHALVPKGCTSLEDPAALQSVVEKILRGDHRVNDLARVVAQRILPLSVAPHGLLEISNAETLADATCAMVSADAIEDVKRLFQVRSVRPTRYGGWSWIAETKFGARSLSEVERTTLASSWILHETISPPSLHLIDGIRVDDGWMGALEALPSIRCDSDRLELQVHDGPWIDLKRSEELWRLPREDLNGTIQLRGRRGEATVATSLRFYLSPSTEAPKPAGDPVAWYVEGRGRVTNLSQDFPFALAGGGDWAELVDEPLLLGPGVGEFVSDPEEAAWEIRSFAGRFVGQRGRLRGEGARPRYRVSNAQCRSRWRNMLLKSTGAPSDPDYEAARNSIKGLVGSNIVLPSVDPRMGTPEIRRSEASAEANPKVDRTVRIVGAIAANRSGIEMKDWWALLGRTFALPMNDLRRITRAWCEAALIDVGSFARWRKSCVFVRPPRLVAFDSGGGWTVTVSGLVLQATEREFRRQADALGYHVESRGSPSPWLPRSMRTRVDSEFSAKDLASRMGVGLVRLDLPSILASPSQDYLLDGAPPGHYLDVRDWHRWSLSGTESPGGPTFRHHVHPSRPDFWSVTTSDRRAWSYDLNTARIWAASALGESGWAEAGSDRLKATHAYLPLPLARMLAIVGEGFAGPMGNGDYVYPVRKAKLKSLVAGAAGRWFDWSRLVAENSEE